MPEPINIAWRNGKTIRVRHDDPHLGIYTGNGQQVRSAILVASDVEGLRLTPTRRLRVWVA